MNIKKGSLCTREPYISPPLRIVGSGFCPMVRGLPRAMLATDVSVGKAEKLESEMIEKYYD